MLVSHRNKFIFTKTTKTAGTSVEVFFEKYCFPKGFWEFSHAREEYINKATGIVGFRGIKNENNTYYNHMSAKKLKNRLGSNIWKQYFKFTVIRNPFDKMVSAFFHYKKFGSNEEYTNNRKNDVLKFRDWVKNGGAAIDRSAYLINDKVALDYFIRYENLLDGIEFVCKNIGVAYDLRDLPNLKADYRDRSLSLKDMYDDKTANLVRDLYRFEIEYFGYELN